MMDFPTWYNAGCYGGLVFCMCAIATNALYTSLRRRGTTAQLTRTIVLCAVSALLLLPAMLWFSLRFSTMQATLSRAEVAAMLSYVALCGWLLPIGVTITYILFARPRTTVATTNPPLQQSPTQTNSTGILNPPRYQPGVTPPFVFDEETPWGWLEYRSGNFQGQRLALKRSIATIGRDENCDIWLDDDMASRHHAELAWHDGQTYLTDCGSLNGTLLNGQTAQGTTLLATNDQFEIGEQRFVFILAERQDETGEDNDPLAHHKWRSSLDLQSNVMPVTHVPPSTMDTPVQSRTPSPPSPLPQSSKPTYILLIRDGEQAGQNIPLGRPQLVIGRDDECNVVINDLSISRQHVQFLHQTDGDYVQDLGSRNGTYLNEQLLHSHTLAQLHAGDVIGIGNVHLQYASMQEAQTPPIPEGGVPPISTSQLSGPMPLKLPSRAKQP
ncbi:MAG TPA: FHA domain-containing protein [Ktedonobacteraceae bacterium]|nr:FHA domain-containing protein [Ktedonobacteraceae bacterium]